MRKIKHLLLGLFAAFMLSSCGYNSMVSGRESVEAKWGNVESQYQRRADLVPNLVKIAKNYADYEQETLTKVVEARSKAKSLTIDAANITEADIAKFQKVQESLKSSMGSAIDVLIERYPDLKSNQNFLELQAQLEGTENRISTARIDYNDAVQKYNSKIKSFPKMLYAGLFGFKAKPYFKGQEGSENAPDVDEYFGS